MKTATPKYDVKGMGIGRLFRLYVRGRVTPVWVFGEELKIGSILTLAIRHHLGYPMAYLTTRYERQWQTRLEHYRRVAGRFHR